MGGVHCVGHIQVSSLRVSLPNGKFLMTILKDCVPIASVEENVDEMLIYIFLIIHPKS